MHPIRVMFGCVVGVLGCVLTERGVLDQLKNLSGSFNTLCGKLSTLPCRTALLPLDPSFCCCCHVFTRVFDQVSSTANIKPAGKTWLVFSCRQGVCKCSNCSCHTTNVFGLTRLRLTHAGAAPAAAHTCPEWCGMPTAQTWIRHMRLRICMNNSLRNLPSKGCSAAACVPCLHSFCEPANRDAAAAHLLFNSI